MSIAESDVNANVNDESLDLRCKLIVRDVFAVQLTAIGYIYALERDVILVKLACRAQACTGRLGIRPARDLCRQRPRISHLVDIT